MGTYDSGSYGKGFDDVDNPYMQDRQSARDRLADALARNNTAQRGVYAGMKAKEDKAQADAAHNYGGGIAKGAMLGGMIGGAPGAAIGGGAGALLGMGKDVAYRRQHGEGWGSAIGHTAMDLPGSVLGMLNDPAAVPAAMGIAGSMKEEPLDYNEAMGYGGFVEPGYKDAGGVYAATAGGMSQPSYAAPTAEELGQGGPEAIPNLFKDDEENLY